MKIAVKHEKPLVVHSRTAEEDSFHLMTKYLPKEWNIHLHCFTDSKEFAMKLLDHFPNLFIGFTGIRSNSKTRKLFQPKLQ